MAKSDTDMTKVLEMAVVLSSEESGSYAVLDKTRMDKKFFKDRMQKLDISLDGYKEKF